MGPLKLLVVVFLSINALFWGLFPHHVHCRFAASLGVTKCPSHWIHITMGVGCFLVAVLVAQWHMFKMA